jgi:5-(carboxyamino)imidazole ribonucleotide synthase
VSPTVGVLGGGQLGRMLGLAGVRLGIDLCFLEPAEEPPAASTGRHLCAAYDDENALDELAALCDVVTYEFENVPAESARRVATRTPVFPSVDALEVSQDRLAEKEMLEKAGVPVSPYEPVMSQGELERALERIGLPAVVKTRRLGYDGKGQTVVRDPAEAARVFEDLGRKPLIVEGFVPFTRELSLIAVRGLDGTIACYPLVENHHRDGILRTSLAPAPETPESLRRQAESFAKDIVEGLGYVGVIAVEMFQVDGELLANEIAPRVHNSGHWTIEGATCSQFENHLRAILGLPLGSTEARGCCAMVNLIGEVPPLRSLLDVGGAHVHVYGKRPRPERKVGHVSICVADPAARDRLVDAVGARLQSP